MSTDPTPTPAGSVDSEATGHASLGGYLTVWAICGVTASVAAVFLAVVHAADRPVAPAPVA